MIPRFLRDRDNARLLAAVAKVEVEGAGGVRVGGVATGQVVAELEVGAEGAEPVAVGAGPVELVGGAQVEVDSGVGVDRGGAVGADEGDVTVQAGGGVVGGCVIGDGHAGEYGILQVVVVGVVGVGGGELIGGHAVGDGPLHDVGDAGLDGLGRKEVEVERAGLLVEAGVAGLAVAEGHQGGSFEGCAVELVTALGLVVTEGEGQAEGVPRAVLVEGAARECHVIDQAVGGVDGGAVAGGIAEGQVAVVGSQGLACKRVVVAPAAFVAVLVVERLAVGDVHGFAGARAVAAGLDEVGGVGPAEGDVPVGIDAVAVFAGGGDLAAGDGDVAAGIDAFAVAGGGDLAAGDGDAASGRDAIAVGAGGGDGAAADDDNAIFDAVVGGGDVEGAGAEGLAVDGQYVVGAFCKDAVIIVHGHRIAVGQDDVHIVLAVNRAAVADVAVHHVPLGRAFAAEAGLAAGEHGGEDDLLVAFGVDVADGLGGLRPRRGGG